jgi:8-oxo-dGTP diphosphatase
MSNPFETGARKNIPAVLIYARTGSEGERKILMIHRDAPGLQAADYHAGKWNGLGGKCELNESAAQAAMREFKEEAGVSVPLDRFRPLGVLQFPNFKAHKSEDWTVFVFVVDLDARDAGRVLLNSAEGSLHWVPEQDLPQLNLWPGDRHFISHVVNREFFQGAIWYDGSNVARHEIVRLTC